MLDDFGFASGRKAQEAGSEPTSMHLFPSPGKDNSFDTIIYKWESDMAGLEKIALDKLKIFERVSEVKTGTLLQLSPNKNSSPIGIKAEMPVAGGEMRGVTFLEGGDAGFFLTDQELDDCPAIDITELATVMLAEPIPQRFGMTSPQAGAVCRVVKPGEEVVAIAVRTSSYPHVEGYMRLAGSRCGHIEKATSPLYLGRATVVENDLDK